MRYTRLAWLGILGAALAAAGPADTATAPSVLPTPAKGKVSVAKLEVTPARITLTNPFAYAQLVVTATLASGDKLDATHAAELEPPAKLLKVSATRLARPAADGEGALKVKFGGREVSVPVKVTGQKEKYKVDFARDVMPVLSRLGCN